VTLRRRFDTVTGYYSHLALTSEPSSTGKASYDKIGESGKVPKTRDFRL
jgi:hypothetical protein